MRLRARPSCRNRVCPFTTLGESDPPQRRGAPLAAGRATSRPALRIAPHVSLHMAPHMTLGAAVGQALAHVVHEEIGVRPDELPGQRLDRPVGAGGVLRGMASDAARSIEERLAREHVGIVHRAPGRHRKVPAVEDDRIHDRRRRLELVRVRIRSRARVGAMRRVPAGPLPLGAFAPGRRRERTGDPDVAGHRRRALIGDGRGPRLPAEAAEHHPPLGPAPHPPRPARDPVTVRVAGVGPRRDVGFRDRFEESQPDHRRGDPRAGHDPRVQRPIAGIDNRVARRLQGGRLASRKDHLAGGAGDPESCLPPHGPEPRRPGAGSRRWARG